MGNRERKTAPKKARKQTARDQGVPDVYLSESGSFRVGMDSRYKSDLIHAALGIPSEKALMSFEPADAKKRLRKRGWNAFLERKRQILAAKTKADAAQAEEAA